MTNKIINSLFLSPVNASNDIRMSLKDSTPGHGRIETGATLYVFDRSCSWLDGIKLGLIFMSLTDPAPGYDGIKLGPLSMSLKGSGPGHDGIKLGQLFMYLKGSTPGYEGIKLGPLSMSLKGSALGYDGIKLGPLFMSLTDPAPGLMASNWDHSLCL